MDTGPIPEQTRRRFAERQRREADALERRRTHRFLWAQLWLVMAIGVVFSILGPSLGLMTSEHAEASGWMSLVILLYTWLGLRYFQRTQATGKLVLAVLYLDAVVGVFGFFFIGEYETPNLALMILAVFMAPLFGSKKHAWGIASVQLTLYGMLLGLRMAGLVPYDPVLPAPDLTEFAQVHHLDLTQVSQQLTEERLLATQLADEGFVGDSFLGFLVLVFGAAFLAGEASLGLVLSKRQLQEEVDNATRRLGRANTELNERNRALDEFNAALSHDLKSPLQTALLAAEALIYSQPGLSADQRKLAETIVNSSSRMGDLSRELLNLSRITDSVGDGERVVLREILDQVVEDLGAQLAESGAELMVSGDLPDVLGNPSLLREAIQNLVENALKYGDPDHPRIRVEAAKAPWGKVAFAIEDNGPGIPEDQRDLVFRPFLRLNRDRDRGGGVGAGLAIVQRIVSVHGGRVRAEAGDVLEGARFVVELSAFGALETLRD